MVALLEQVDRTLFLFLNGIHTPFFDEVMFWFSEEITWIPLYALLLFLLFRRLGWRATLLAVVLVALTITLTDQLSVKAFKNVFERYRPCHNLEIQHLVHIVKEHCGGQYGFVSSHAANTFGLATILGLLFESRKTKWWLLGWAAVVSYSRIYLGVHYPFDIIGGAILGILIGYFTYSLKRFFPAHLQR